MAEEKEKGMNIFLDVFRRADKNDDGALSWEEFKSFFADGVLSEEELRNLFHEIDTHNTNNIDTGELCAYFSSHLGPFKAIFAALDDLMPAVSEAVRKSAQEAPSSSVVDQFVTRFLLREILQQMTAIEAPLDNAFTSLDDMATNERAVTGTPVTVVTPQKTRREVNEVNIDSVAATGSIVPGRLARRARRQISSQTSWGSEITGGQEVGILGQQVERLRTLVDRMENKVNFEGITEEEFPDYTDDKLLLVVQRKFTACEEQSRAFTSCLRRYVEETNKEPACLHIQVRGYRGTSSVMVYEIWQSEDDWKNNVSSVASKTFRHSCVDLLEIPESSATLSIPDTWWGRD